MDERCDKHGSALAHWKFVHKRAQGGLAMKVQIVTKEVVLCNHCTQDHWMSLTRNGFVPIPVRDDAREPIGVAWR